MGATHPRRRCTIRGCKSWCHGRGWCKLHYYRWKRQGDPNILTRPSFRDLTDQHFGRLTVLSRAPNGGKDNRRTRWNCLCDCGNKTVVDGSNLQIGCIRSCGCLLRELEARGGGALKHGACRGGHRLPEYVLWCGMIARCTNPKNKRWTDYGGRGIVVCQRWRWSFAAFFKDMGKRPTPKHSLERNNNNRGYSPANCRWATNAEQSTNRRPRRWYRKPHPA